MTKRKKPSSNGPDDVGYKKPPKHTQFPKGTSGNPGGRPKKPKLKIYTLEDARKSFLRHSLKRIKMNVGDEVVDISFIEAAMYQAMAKAAKGDPKMIKYVLGEFFAHAHDFGEDKIKQIDFYYDTKEIFLEKAKKFLASEERWPDEEIEKINFLREMMEIFADRIKETMDGSKN